MTADDTVQALAELLHDRLAADAYRLKFNQRSKTTQTKWLNEARAVLDSGLVVPAAAMDGEDEQVRRAIADAMAGVCTPAKVRAVMAVVQPLLAKRDAAAERADKADAFATKVADDCAELMADLDTAHDDTQAETGRADEAEADLAAARGQLDQLLDDLATCHNAYEALMARLERDTDAQGDR